jgi:predicted ATP-binding protein involved in virulence
MLVCDIARRLTIANPALENKLEGEGVVMIDEIELHLHPAWQRNVLPALQQTFPNIQFIVTTHSPQVLGGIERESLFILKDFQLQEYTPHTKGRDSNSILKEVQGVDERLPAYREKLDKLAKLLDDENVNEAGKLLVELKKDLGERDVEIAKIETIMHFFDD